MGTTSLGSLRPQEGADPPRGSRWGQAVDGMALFVDAASMLYWLSGDAVAATWLRAAALGLRAVAWWLRGRSSVTAPRGQRWSRALELVALGADAVVAAMPSGVWSQVVKFTAVTVRSAVWWLRRPRNK